MTVFDIVINFRKILLDGLSVTIMLGVIMLIGGMILGSIYAGILSAQGDSKALKIARKVVHILVEIFRGEDYLLISRRT